ncbi:LacI family DNA-binding transcriptional regulator [Geofilum sp. OHC36d9]|uniref:LacI family DNA-binding transcriptional regulator n=1 Tax=Geofilum sp. OHC36d9 TaxID=3458413 RepID=UPI004033AA11
MTKASLKTIAQAAGVSKTTASFVLNGKGDTHKINKNTQEKILRIANELDYRPSFLSQVFNTGKTMTIGLIAPDLTDPFTSELTENIADQCNTNNYNVITAFTHHNKEKETGIIFDLTDRHTDALVIVDPANSEDILAKALTRAPILLVNPQYDYQLPSLRPDYEYGVNLLLQHHIRRHHKAIGFINEPDAHNSIKTTYQLNYLERFDITADYFTEINDADSLTDAVEKLLEKKINAIMLSSVHLARQLITLINSTQLNIPESIDISCAGWHPCLELTKPAITGYRQNATAYATVVNQWLINSNINPITTIKPILHEGP